jgi:phenylpropionate dioxygenase-like ring-hydroxylating dioxygenase large terminal subunit
MSLTRVAVLRRTIRASLARVRENVLDWEHLPWLHRETFGHVRLLERRRDGFRAETARRGGAAFDPFEIDVAFEPDGLTYHSRTVTGAGTGTDIVTCLESRGAGTTHIEVEFLVPNVLPREIERLGAAYLRLYTRLWDQDEAMMVRRQDLLDGRLVLGKREVCVDGLRVRHATVCPHRGGPLDDVPVEDGCITCPWHGYRFDLLSGRSADGRALCLDTETLEAGRE